MAVLTLDPMEEAPFSIGTDACRVMLGLGCEIPEVDGRGEVEIDCCGSSAAKDVNDRVDGALVL